jgi:hypothetical protein
MCVLFLIANGANVHVLSAPAEFNVCHFAAFGCDSLAPNLDIQHLLVAAGCDYNAVTKTGFIARDRTRRDVSADCVERYASRLGAQSRVAGLCRPSIAGPRRAADVRGSATLMRSCVAAFIPFHVWWSIATTVKHFHSNSSSDK